MSMPQQVPDPSDYHLSEPDREWEMLALACDIAATKCMVCEEYGHTHYDCPLKLGMARRVPVPALRKKSRRYDLTISAGLWVSAFAVAIYWAMVIR